MSLVCFDNHVLIWGIKEEATEGQEDHISRTKRFIEKLPEDDIVLIPSVVLAEFLLPIPSNLHATVINLFNRNFKIAPFDALAASKMSLVWQTNNPPDNVKKIIDSQTTRAELRADAMIVATAIAQNADCIYSHDNWIKTFAKGFIDVKEVPFVPKEMDIFETNSENIDWGKPPPKINTPSDN